MRKFKNAISVHYRELLLLGLALIFTYIIACFLIIQKNSNRIYSVNDPKLVEVSSRIKVGIVFGGGVGLDRPSTIVKDRLDTAKELLDGGSVDILLLSGDNRYDDYNEPQVMYDYLVQQGVSTDKLQRDFAGRSTFATCERAKKVFGINSAMLISQDTHLPRAVYLCSHFGIDSYGVKAESETRKRTWVYQRAREFFARAKAVFNIYLIGEETILGDPININ
jgi:vancomycin permeability regulator SanA